ncbi:MAG: MOSC domain-containing protein [Oculatellaceae cyanobacterium bins.114]|nr:MOSC domain-containing protein [Oculatellaceae cyanobacterium bins.114]
MVIHVGRISAIFRYPVKSMAGESVDVAQLGWHGIEGDRRFAFRRLSDKSGFPWLTAGRLPELILYRPFRNIDDGAIAPTHVQTPTGDRFELFSEALRDDISRRFGSAVELMQMNHGIFDEASISIINLTTLQSIEHTIGRSIDIRRFRPNIVIETFESKPFAEDAWVGRKLTFGSDTNAAIQVTMPDPRCSMINLDPDTATPDPAVMQAVVRLNQNNAGAYGTVVGAGEIRVGQTVSLMAESE